MTKLMRSFINLYNFVVANKRSSEVCLCLSSANSIYINSIFSGILHTTPHPNSTQLLAKKAFSQLLKMVSKDTSMASLATQICTHISSIFTKPTHPYPQPLDLMVTELTATSSQKGRVFLYGVGREGLMLKALCMRLAHLGLSAHLVFDMTTPPISATDLLIASAGPGGFSTVDAICHVARSSGARVLLLTAQPETGSCVKHASVVCYVPAQTMADDEDDGDVAKSRPLLPMGSVYEGALFVLFEMVVYKLGEVLGESTEAVRSRHTNLE